MLNKYQINTAADHYVDLQTQEFPDTPHERCRNLIKAVLLQAFWDLRHKKEDPDVRYDAYQWFMSHETGLFLCFYNVCQILEINHALIQARIKLKYGDVMRKESCVSCGESGIRDIMHHDPVTGYYRCKRCEQRRGT